MSAPDPRKKIRRKKPRETRMVTFEVPELFEGEFNLPSLKKISVGQARRLGGAESLDTIAAMLEEVDASDELEAFEDLEPDEIEVFLKAWQTASEADLPKSSG
jgi:hypothetical protein